MTEKKLAKTHHVIDNHREKLSEYMRPKFNVADILRMVSAYFSIYGFELLEQELKKIKSVRLLFGDPDSVADLDPGSKKTKTFKITEAGLSPYNRLKQKHLAERCTAWIKRNDVCVRSIKQQGFLHGKMYHTTESAGQGTAVVGSSNFTRRGLGGGKTPNLEINLAIGDKSEGEWLSLKEWFDDVWVNDDRTKDVKEEILQALARVGKDYSPELIYYKTLFELFREKIDNLPGDDEHLITGLEKTKIWSNLYGFQQDAAKIIIGRLKQQDGCILADSVGLGKTYTALAVIKHYEIEHNANVLVLCPKKLSQNWVLYPAANARHGNPFMEDSFRFTVLSHTDLSRNSGNVGAIDLAEFDWGAFRLVVIDESHNFRNATKSPLDKNGHPIRLSRYERLLKEVIAGGGNTKVLMLSATPVNTSLTDLRNQIRLLTSKRDDAFRNQLGIESFENMLNATQKKFKSWETRKSKEGKAALVEDLGADFFNLLGAVSIARSRKQIKKFYANEIAKIGGFPVHEKPENEFPATDLKAELSYRQLNEQINAFSLAIYNPTKYLTSEKAIEELKREKKRYRFNQEDREKFLLGMIRMNFLKRLESSSRSLSLTLTRTIRKMDEMLERIAQFTKGGTQAVEIDAAPDEDDDDEEFLVNRGRHPFHLGELDTARWQKDLEHDRHTLKQVLTSIKQITPERDGKLQELKKKVRTRIKNPTKDKDGRPNRKMLVFTSFKDTAEYIYEELQSFTNRLGIRMAMVAGDVVHAPEEKDLQSVLSRFAPRAQGAKDQDGQIDLLIATDCISEGQNLQDCDVVLNYDIHWNPVRLIQRFGRIDRIGSHAKYVRMINFWPTEDMDFYLNLKPRVEARMALADIVATGDENRLEYEAVEEQVRTDLNFRDQELIRLQDMIGDLDDYTDGVVMSDFTLDYYLTQLMHYLKRFQTELENMDYGAYAVVESEEEGVIFFLRQTNAPSDKNAWRTSPTSPFFLIYLREDGLVKVGHMQPKRTLDEFENLSVGKTNPLQDLCDEFDAETQQGQDMSRYEALLDASVASILNRFREALKKQVVTGGGKIPKYGEQPNNLEDFELITWLVVRRKKQGD